MEKQKKFLVTIQPEWTDDLDQIKREQFYNTSKAQMMRRIISAGIKAMKADKQPTTT